MKKNSSSSRVTLRDIAAAADVSLMTVSYALRNRPEVSPEERLRIQRLAETLGYRPDPLLTHLMTHLRTQRTPQSSANLAVLTLLDAGFVRRLITGASDRAHRLGYNLDRIDARQALRNPKALNRSLLARGIRGVLLAPAEGAASYRGLIDWNEFAVVAMTYSLVEPHVHRVVTHHFDNAVRTFSLLVGRGYRRIGLAMNRDMEFRSNHSYSGAYLRLQALGGATAMPILFLDECSPTQIRRWFSRNKPEVVVLANANHLETQLRPHLGPQASERTAVVCLDTDPAFPVSGMDQLFEKIGGHAVDALVAQIHRGERGLPANPTVTMVEGQWREDFGLHPLRSVHAHSPRAAGP